MGLAIPFLKRKRYSSQPVNVVAGGLAAVKAGAFGIGSPLSQSSSPFEVAGQAGNWYALHEGDLITPGTGNWVLDPSLETPLQTQWGNGFLRRANVWNPLQPPQVYSQPHVIPTGIGGVVAGQMYNQPLSSDTLGPQG